MEKQFIKGVNNGLVRNVSMCVILMLFGSVGVSAIFPSTPDQMLITDNRPSSISVGDLNGDGLEDIVIGNLRAKGISIFFQKFDHTFSTMPDLTISTENQGLETSETPKPQIGDLNNDGLNDIAISIYGTESWHGTVGRWILVFLQKPNHTFSQIADQILITDRNPGEPAIGDLNNDGLNDIVVGNAWANTISIFLQRLDHTFPTTPDQTLSTGQHPANIAVGDVNNDGLNDIVSPDQLSFQLSIFLQRLDHTFPTTPDQTLIAVTNPPTPTAGANRVAIGDVNNDGLNDILCNGPFGIRIFLQNANHTFFPNPDMILPSTGDNPGQIIIVDLNHDDLNDIAFTDVNTGKVIIFLQRENNTFPTTADQVLSTDGIEPYTIDSGDLNHDGLNDIAVSIDGSDAVAIFLQRPRCLCITQSLIDDLQSKIKVLEEQIQTLNGTCQSNTEKIDELDTRTENLTDRVGSLEDGFGTFQIYVNESILALNNSLNSLEGSFNSFKAYVNETIASIEESIDLIQTAIDGFMSKINSYLSHLPFGLKKQMVCGYMEDNNLTSYDDLGLHCELKNKGKGCVCHEV